MKPKFNSTKLLHSLATTLLKLRGLILTLVFVGLVGYTGYIVSQIVNLQPDQAYLTDQRTKLDQSKISFDKKTIQTINNLQQVNPPIDLSHIGKSDPFSP